jgi:hypothetical protein
MERDAQEKLTNTQITAADIATATPGQHLMIIESTLTTAITVQLNELFNGPWALDTTRRQPPALTLWKKSKWGKVVGAPTANRKLAVEEARESEWRRLITTTQGAGSATAARQQDRGRSDA